MQCSPIDLSERLTQLADRLLSHAQPSCRLLRFPPPSTSHAPFLFSSTLTREKKIDGPQSVSMGYLIPPVSSVSKRSADADMQPSRTFTSAFTMKYIVLDVPLTYSGSL